MFPFDQKTSSIFLSSSFNFITVLPWVDDLKRWFFFHFLNSIVPNSLRALEFFRNNVESFFKVRYTFVTILQKRIFTWSLTTVVSTRNCKMILTAFARGLIIVKTYSQTLQKFDDLNSFSKSLHVTLKKYFKNF